MRRDVERAIRECYPDRAEAMLRVLERATRSYRTSRRYRRRDRMEIELEHRLAMEATAVNVTERAYSKAMRELARAVAKPAKKVTRIPGAPRGPRR